MRAFFVDVLAGTLPGQSDANSTLLFPQEDPRVCAPPLPPHRTHTSSLAVSLDASTPREEFPHWLPPRWALSMLRHPLSNRAPVRPRLSGGTCNTAVGQPTASGAVRPKSRAPHRAPSELGRRHSQLGGRRLSRVLAVPPHSSIMRARHDEHPAPRRGHAAAAVRSSEGADPASGSPPPRSPRHAAGHSQS